MYLFLFWKGIKKLNEKKEKLGSLESQISIEKNSTKVFIHVTIFMFFSSIMLVINKLAIKFFFFPSTLLFIQMFLTTIILWIFGQIGYIHLEKLQWSKIKAYMGVVFLFMINLYSNMKVLELSTVETVIVFRTLSSLVIAYGDYKLLKKKLPNIQAIFSLLLIVMGSLLYAWTDDAFRLDAYIWGIIYLIVKVADTLYTKYVVDNEPMSNWSRSFYNNIISLIPVGIIAISTGEPQALSDMVKLKEISIATIVLVLISSLIGIGISVSGFMCRELVTATSFSVIGNMNKILTIILNYLVISDHANIYGLGSLFVCLLGGIWYTKATAKYTF